MAYALKAFRRIQVSNPENTVGTAEAAVEVFYGTLAIPHSDLIIHYPEQDRNSLARHMADDFVVGKEINFTLEGELNHRHAAWLFSNAIRGNITPAAVGTATPNAYTWTFEPGLTTANTPDITNGIDTFTYEFGDNVQAYEAEYCITKTLTIEGGPNEAVMFSSEIVGRQLTETTFTGSLTAATVQYFPYNNSKFYIDTSYAGIGGTQKTGMLRAFKWTLETMFTVHAAADGGKVFTVVAEDRKAPELELTYYRDGTNSEAEYNKYAARTTTYLRIELLADTEMDSGGANPPYIFLDGAYRYTDWPEIDDEDGISVETVTAQGVYDATAAKMFGVTLATDLATYPA